jgi:hypothetical protein
MEEICSSETPELSQPHDVAIQKIIISGITAVRTYHPTNSMGILFYAGRLTLSSSGSGTGSTQPPEYN